MPFNSAPPPPPKFPPRADLFFAVYLDAVAAARGGKLARSLCHQSLLSGRPRPVETLHVTLVPVGVASLLPAEAFLVLERAAAVVNQTAFDVVFDRAMSFRNGALVLRCGDGVSALTALQESLHAAIGFHAPSRFTPHVTLAYCRTSIAETALEEPIGWTVREFVLAQSLTGRGEHVPLARWPLRDGFQTLQ